MKIGIKRLCSIVQINLECANDYHAMEVYDRLLKSAKNGEVKIDLKARERPSTSVSQ